MSGGFEALGRIGATIRPLSNVRPKPAYRTSPFSSSLTSTVNTLATELRNLDAKQVELELAFRDQDLRLDGMPRANAVMTEPTVVLSFESRFGPLRYATAEYRSWEDNLRAIALAMQALRAVDRYGVSKRGEQYQGWRALPMSTGDPADQINSREDAARVLLTFVEDTYAFEDIYDDGSAGAGAHQQEAIREAQRRTHPDRGGDALDFRKVTRCKELLA